MNRFLSRLKNNITTNAPVLKNENARKKQLAKIILKTRKKTLEGELYQEELDHPVVSEEQILHALYHYKSLNISTKEGKQRLVDSFVNSIYLYDDRYVITFNYKNKSKTVTFEEIESSSLTSKASPKNRLVI